MPDFDLVRRLVAACPIFKPLDAPMLGSLLVTGKVRRLAVGEIIYRKGEPSTSTFFLILRGVAHVLRAHSDEVEFDKSEGDVLGEVALVIPQHVRTRSVVAGTDLVIMEWDMTALGADVRRALEPHLETIAFERLAQSLE